MDKEINDHVFAVETIAKKFEAEGYLTTKETDEIYDKLADVRRKMLEADKKYDAEHKRERAKG